MRRLAIWSLVLGMTGVIASGVVLFGAIDNPKARVSLAAWGFILSTMMAGGGIFILSITAGRRRDGGGA